MRGKYKARATNKRSEQETEALIARLEKEVSTLQADKESLQQQVVAKEAAGQKEIARLQADLHAGVSPELKASKAQLADLLEEVGKVRLDAATQIKNLQSLLSGILAHLDGAPEGIPPEIYTLMDEVAGGMRNIGDVLGWKKNLRRVNGNTGRPGVPTSSMPRKSVAEIAKGLG